MQVSSLLCRRGRAEVGRLGGRVRPARETRLLHPTRLPLRGISSVVKWKHSGRDFQTLCPFAKGGLFKSSWNPGLLFCPLGPFCCRA